MLTDLIHQDDSFYMNEADDEHVEAIANVSLIHPLRIGDGVYRVHIDPKKCPFV